MSKRRRTMSPLAVALIADHAAKTAPIYTEASQRKLRGVAESAPTITRQPERTAVRETPTIIGPAATPGRFRVCLIRAGWSLNGSHYSADVLKEAARTGQWAAGTLNYVDHDTDEEEQARPSGSLMRLASYQTTDARWDDAEQGLVAEVRAFAPWREAVADWAESKAIGMSIRAWVYGQDGEAEGRQGFIVTEIVESRSCDYVTVPAAGGAILSVLESVRRRATREDATIGAWLESRLHLALTTFADDMYGDGRLTRDERITLSAAIGDGLQAYTTRVEADAPQLYQRTRWTYPEPAPALAEEARRAAEATAEERRSALGYVIAEKYGDDETYTWVRDYDPDAGLVWYDTCPRDGENTTWQQSYTVDADGVVALAGDPVEVIPRTVYDPAPADPEPDAVATTPGTAAGESVGGPAPDPGEGAPIPDVTDGAPPTVTDPPIEEETGMPETQTGGAAPPEQAGTAPVVDTPAPTSEAANRALLEAMQALTAQVTALTDANAVLTVRANERDAEARTQRNRQTARDAVAAALSTDTVPADLRAQIEPRVTAAVLADIPVTESGDVHTERLTAAVTAAIEAESGYAARLLESAGVGRPRGLGSPPPAAQTVDEFEKQMAEHFKAINPGMTDEAARIAAKGRG